MNEHHMSVGRTARYYTLGSLDADVEEVWIACHGFGQLAGRFIRHLAPLADGKRTIVAPEALNRFYLDPSPGPHGADAKVGATWMTREDRLHEIRDYVAYLDSLAARIFERLDRRRSRLIVLGFSQGAATVVRWVVQGRVSPDHLILWGSGLPSEIDIGTGAEVLRGIQRVSVVVGERDEWATPERVSAEQARLTRLGVNANIMSHPGGHHLDSDVLLRLAG